LSLFAGDKGVATKRTKIDLKPQTLALINAARQEFERIFTAMPEEQRHTAGTLKQWSPKDELAHLAYWIELFVTNIRAQRAGQPLIDTRDYRTMNDRGWEERKAWRWDAVKQAVTDVLSAVETEINTLSAEDLVNASHFTLEADRSSPRPLLHSLIYELIDHPNHHFSGLYRKLGDDAAITALFDRSLQALAPLGSTRWSAKTSRAAQKHQQRSQAQPPAA
jgi:hypothetical protein